MARDDARPRQRRRVPRGERRGSSRPRGLGAAGDPAGEAAGGDAGRRRRRLRDAPRSSWRRRSAQVTQPPSSRSATAGRSRPSRDARQPLPPRPHAPPARPADRDPPPLRPPLRARRLRRQRPGDPQRRRRRGAGGAAGRRRAPRCATASASSTRPSGSRRTRSASSAPNQDTVGGVQMSERLLRACSQGLEAAGGLPIGISAGVVACPEHGADAEAASAQGRRSDVAGPCASGSPWAWAPCKIADRFRKSVHNLRKPGDSVGDMTRPANAPATPAVPTLI